MTAITRMRVRRGDQMAIVASSANPKGGAPPLDAKEAAQDAAHPTLATVDFRLGRLALRGARQAVAQHGGLTLGEDAVVLHAPNAVFRPHRSAP